MKKVKIQIFSSGSPYCSSCVEILNLAEEIEKKYRNQVELVRLVGDEVMSKLEEYGFTCVPAMRVGERIKFEGLCPSLSTVEEAIKEELDGNKD
uniref:Thioredoxin-like fold domain-containing protein n=1 Tax=candidate division WOR-3 bacterium TaxID=2052148 RepID=A0A7C2P1K2_UNCW3